MLGGSCRALTGTRGSTWKCHALTKGFAAAMIRWKCIQGIGTLIQVRRRGTPHGCDARIISWQSTRLPPRVVECIKPNHAVGGSCHLVSTWMEVALCKCISGGKRLGLL
jgi:hypothetical protein